MNPQLCIRNRAQWVTSLLILTYLFTFIRRLKSNPYGALTRSSGSAVCTRKYLTCHLMYSWFVKKKGPPFHAFKKRLWRAFLLGCFRQQGWLKLSKTDKIGKLVLLQWGPWKRVEKRYCWFYPKLSCKRSRLIQAAKSCSKKVELLYTFCNNVLHLQPLNQICCAASLFNSFCCNNAKQVTRPFWRSFRNWMQRWFSSVH